MLVGAVGVVLDTGVYDPAASFPAIAVTGTVYLVLTLVVGYGRKTRLA